MAKIPSIQEMLTAGLHFGHRTSRWHPRMAPFIFGERNGIHVINLEVTAEKLQEVSIFIDKVIAKGNPILFVGTKAQAKESVKREAIRSGSPYVINRWLGGLLTNFHNVNRISKRLKDLTSKRDSGELNKYTKKEQVLFEKEIQKSENLVGGVKDMERIPGALFVIDVKTDKTAVEEARKKGVPIIAICDTNINPSQVDYIIPANDDSTRGIELIAKTIADMIIDAKAKAATAVVEKPVTKKI